MNDLLDKILHATLWLWLPFAALYRLTKDVIKKYGQDEKK